MHSHILQNAPRQRIRLTANAKEIEAMQSGKVGEEINASASFLTRRGIADICFQINVTNCIV